MPNKILDIVICPLCHDNLVFKDNYNNNEGIFVCNNCYSQYEIKKSIPRMYIHDKKLVTFFDNEFDRFVLNEENLSKSILLTENMNKNRDILSFFPTNKYFTKFLIILGWTFFFFGVSYFVLFYFYSGLSNYNILIYSIIIPLLIFGLDYLRYRKKTEIYHVKDLKILMDLLIKGSLSEYDIRSNVKDNENDFSDEFKEQKLFVNVKSNQINTILNKYPPKGNKILNIGCGGKLHQTASSPYFERGFDVLGIDICEDYLSEYKEIFQCNVIQSNSMALPFKDEIFDLINFTDILEHIHHPFRGLSEANRVLKRNGLIIITTPNRNGINFRSINPWVLCERIIGLYYENILPPRIITSHWMDFQFYHTEFSIKEIIKILNSTNFNVLFLQTSTPIFPRISDIMQKIPIFKFLGSEIIIVAEKNRTQKYNMYNKRNLNF